MDLLFLENTCLHWRWVHRCILMWYFDFLVLLWCFFFFLALILLHKFYRAKRQLLLNLDINTKLHCAVVDMQVSCTVKILMGVYCISLFFSLKKKLILKEFLLNYLHYYIYSFHMPSWEASHWSLLLLSLLLFDTLWSVFGTVGNEIDETDPPLGVLEQPHASYNSGRSQPLESVSWSQISYQWV